MSNLKMKANWEKPNFKMPKVLLWDVTTKCNLECLHCYNADKYNHAVHIKEMSLQEIKDMINGLKEAGITQIHFLGGEPFCRKDLFEIITHAKEKDILISINTNGTLINDFVSNQILNSGVDQLVFSLDGPNEFVNDLIRGKNVFNKCTESIQLLSNLRVNGYPKIAISWTITKLSFQNTQIVKMMFDLCEKLKVDALLVNLLFECGAAQKNGETLDYEFNDALFLLEEVAFYSTQYKNFKVQIDARPLVLDYLNLKYGSNFLITNKGTQCKGSKSHFMLRADGKLFPCAPLDSNVSLNFNKQFLNNFNPPNVTESSFSESIQSSFFRKWSELTSSIVLQKRLPGCAECYYGDICEPCPITYENIEPEECTTVKPKFDNWLSSQFNNIPRINETLSLDDNGLTEQLSDYSLSLLPLMNGKNSVGDIIECIMHKNERHSRYNILHSTLTLISHLKSKGFITIN